MKRQAAMALAVLAALAGINPRQSPTRVRDRTLWTLGGTYKFNAAWQVGLQYWRMTQSYHSPGDLDAKANMFALLVNYSLSKRTDLYAAAEYAKLDHMQLINQAASPAAPNGANSRTAFMVGLRHRF